MRLAEVLRPEMELADAAAVAVNYVFEREARSIDGDEAALRRWQSVDELAIPLEVAYYSDSDMAHYRLAIGGAEPDEITVFLRERTERKALADDPFAEYFFERFAGVYDRHQHLMCMRSVRIARQHQLRKDALRKAQEMRHSMADGAPVRITDKRRVSA